VQVKDASPPSMALRAGSAGIRNDNVKIHASSFNSEPAWLAIEIAATQAKSAYAD